MGLLITVLLTVAEAFVSQYSSLWIADYIILIMLTPGALAFYISTHNVHDLSFVILAHVFDIIFYAGCIYFIMTIYGRSSNRILKKEGS
jgi:hypothetical protein